MPDPRQFDLKLKPEVCYFGVYDNRGSLVPFGIKREDRRRHMYLLGKTGMGKTTYLENMVLQDIYNGEGICFIDPHGDAAEYILDRVPSYRQNDVVYFDPGDTNFPIGFNILEQKSGEEKYLVASEMMGVFTKIWAGMWSSRMEYILNNCILALLDSPGNSLLGITRMLSDKAFRNKIVAKITDPIVRNFWEKEFASFNERYKQEAIAPIQNKIGQFLSSNLTRNIVGQSKSTIDMREIMDKKKILIINLSKGKIGEDASALLGSLLITKIQLAAMSRVNQPEEQRTDFYLYVDEFQNFTTDSFATILSEARKYRLNLILAHQYIAQLSETGALRLKNAVFGNVGSIISFRVGSDDSEFLAKEFGPVFTPQHLQNLNARQIVIKLSIDNAAAGPFLAETLPPVFEKMGGRLALGLKVSRERYGSDVEKVEDSINRWLLNTPESQAPLLNTNPNTILPENLSENNTAPTSPEVLQLESAENENTLSTSAKRRRRRKKSATAKNEEQDAENEAIQQQLSTAYNTTFDGRSILENSTLGRQVSTSSLTERLQKLHQTKMTESNPVTKTLNSQNMAKINPGVGTTFALSEYQSETDPYELP
jgi:hypothetical protein